MDLQVKILKFSCNLYNHFNFTRSDVQFIIEQLQNFVSNDYNPFLLAEINSRVHDAVSKEVSDTINNIFEKHRNPFEKYDSESKRFTLYKNLGYYVEPEIITLKEEQVPKFHGNKVHLFTKKTTMVHLPISNSLRRILQMDGLLEATLLHKEFLESDPEVSMNFIQGSLWKEQTKDLKTNDIVLPLFVYFDDVETGNALGSHAGKNKVGCCYLTIPCFPPNFASKLDSIIVTDLFYSKDRQKFGNKIIFQRLFADLKELEITGIVIIVNNKVYKINFITSLFLGDNLGLNGILGYVESFSLTRFCRVCYAGPSQTSTMTKEDPTELRTQEKYESDLKMCDHSKTGLKERCIFNDLAKYNVYSNQSVDKMHDSDEGFQNYVMSKILLKLIEDDLFTIDYLNHALETIDFGFETSNVPLSISLDYVKTHNRLKMSASESLFFTRYFGLMVGHMVPEDNEAWILYIKLREIVDIINSPKITRSHLLQLDVLIEEHHKMYIKMFGALKPKFHLLLHYIRMMLQNGPVVHTSSMRFESKHRLIKQILNVTSSRKNILQSVGIRLQLGLMHFVFDVYQDPFVTHGSEISDDSVFFHFPHATTRKTLRSVQINDVTYKRESIIVASILENGPVFGKIEKIYVVDNSIFFKYVPFRTIGFNNHFFAFSVVEDSANRKIIEHNCIALRSPCLLYEINDTSYVFVRHIL